MISRGGVRPSQIEWRDGCRVDEESWASLACDALRRPRRSPRALGPRAHGRARRRANASSPSRRGGPSSARPEDWHSRSRAREDPCLLEGTMARGRRPTVDRPLGADRSRGLALRSRRGSGDRGSRISRALDTLFCQSPGRGQCPRRGPICAFCSSGCRALERPTAETRPRLRPFGRRSRLVSMLECPDSAMGELVDLGERRGVSLAPAIVDRLGPGQGMAEACAGRHVATCPRHVRFRARHVRADRRPRSTDGGGARREVASGPRSMEST